MISGMTQVALGDIVTALFLPSTEGTRIIAIDGPSGSGKSNLARRLISRTTATLVEIDDFVSWTDFAGWWPRFDEQVLQRLILPGGCDGSAS